MNTSNPFVPRRVSRQLAILALLAAQSLPSVASEGDRSSNRTGPAMNSMPSTANAKPDAMNVAVLPQLPAQAWTAVGPVRLTGQGQLRFFGLQVYDIKLWAGKQFMPELYDRHPFVLELQYARKLEGAAIAERSIAEMRRVGNFDEAQSRQWLDLMKKAFPDVKAQDRLTGVHDGQGGVQFFFNGQPTAATRDPSFAQLFFGIWLHPRTSAPSLRSALIGDVSP